MFHSLSEENSAQTIKINNHLQQQTTRKKPFYLKTLIGGLVRFYRYSDNICHKSINNCKKFTFYHLISVCPARALQSNKVKGHWLLQYNRSAVCSAVPVLCAWTSVGHGLPFLNVVWSNWTASGKKKQARFRSPPALNNLCSTTHTLFISVQ